jgi:hypothetical protein
VQIGKDAGQVEQQARPEQRQGDVVRQQLRIEIDRRECQQCPDEQHRAGCRPAEAEVPGCKSAQQAADRLDDRIARRDGRAAALALAAQ